MLALRLQHHPTVLVVDDEPFVRSTAAAMLRGYYRVLQAADAATALQMAHSARPDLVVTDVNMPHMGGYELAIALREWRAAQPILFVSGFVATEEVQRALSSRGIGFIEKPFSQEDLLEAISRLLPSVSRTQVAAPPLRPSGATLSW
jgi:CheY-like chemotaxis protein